MVPDRFVLKFYDDGLIFHEFSSKFIGKIKIQWAEIKIEVIYIINIALGRSLRSLPRGVLH